MKLLPECQKFSNALLSLPVYHLIVPNEMNCTFSKDCVKHAFQGNDMKLEVGKFLGSGGFGTVFEGWCFGRKIAVKRINQNIKNPRAINESFLAEKVAMSLRHRNIVRVIGVTDTKYDINSERLILMEYAGHRNLLSIINDEKEELTQCRRLKYASDIANALYYIHKQSIAHLDVKPANIMVSYKNLCKLGDFGCCKVVPESGERSPTTPTNSYLTGTLAYRSPELLKGEYPTCKADMYSYGICLWQLVTREKPFGNDNMYVVIFGVVSYNLRPEITNEMEMKNSSYVRLIQRLWNAEPLERPCPKEVIIKLCSIKLNKIATYNKDDSRERWKI